MMNIYDVTALGELLIDFTQNGTSASGNWMMEANPGGAPCNVLSMLTKLNHKTAFIGQVGNDMFGKMLKERVSSLNIDVSNLFFQTNTIQHWLLFIQHLMATEIFLSIEKPVLMLFWLKKM